MNKIIVLLGLTAAVSWIGYCADAEVPKEAPKEAPKTVETPAEGPKAPAFKSDKEKAGYVFGAAAAQQIVRNYALGEDVDVADVLNGFKDVLSGKAQMSEDEIDQTFVTMYQALDTKDHWKKLNESFLAANEKKEGVKKTESGLQYKVIVEGKGETPKAADAVNAFYRGKFVNGIEFDSSYRHSKEPANFPVDKVIPGWTEALKMMKTGSKWKLYIPANLAYGSAPKNNMRPDSTLIFDIELVDIGPPKAAPAHQGHP